MYGADSIEVPPLASAITKLANWGDFSACADSQEHALAALPGSQLHGYLGCSAGTLSRQDSQWATFELAIGRSRHFKISRGLLCTGDMQIR
jgi:hypothetical protein